MTNKQAFIIGFCVIIGLILHAFISRESFEIGLWNDQIVRINKQTGEASLFTQDYIPEELKEAGLKFRPVE